MTPFFAIGVFREPFRGGLTPSPGRDALSESIRLLAPPDDPEPPRPAIVLWFLSAPDFVERDLLELRPGASACPCFRVVSAPPKLISLLRFISALVFRSPLCLVLGLLSAMINPSAGT